MRPPRRQRRRERAKARKAHNARLRPFLGRLEGLPGAPGGPFLLEPVRATGTIYILDYIVPGDPVRVSLLHYHSKNSKIGDVMQLNFPVMEDILMANHVVTAAEVEKFKIERVAELEFIDKLTSLVRELEAKVSPKSSVLRSMQRFIKASV